MTTRTIKQVVTAFAVTLLVLATGVAPAAAQDEYPSDPSTAIVAVVEADGGFQVSLTVVAPADVVSIVVEYNPVVYAGPVPAAPITFTVPDCAATVTTTYFFADNSSTSESTAVNGVGDCFRPAAVIGTSPVASDTDQVAGVATTSVEEAPSAAAAPPAPPLALTGNDVSVPLAVGAGLIAVGSMAVLIARKREDA